MRLDPADMKELDEQTLRLVQAVLPKLSDAEPLYAIVALTAMLAGYIALISNAARVDTAKADAMVDGTARRLRRMVHENRAYHANISEPGNA